MISRRALVGTGLTAATAAVVVVTARVGGVLDDVLRGLGSEPHPEPDQGDVRRLRRASTAQAALIASIDATIDRHGRLAGDLQPLRVVADEQLVAVGGRVTSTEAPDVPPGRRAATAELSLLAAASAEAREDDAVSAASPDVARVLASMSAGLSQLAAGIAEAS
ncbi:MAG: hypothetical protein ACR2FE_03455 [Aeromicrobium sp.]